MKCWCCAFFEELPEGGARCCASVVSGVQQALTRCEASLELQGEVLVPVLSPRNCLREVQGAWELQGWAARSPQRIEEATLLVEII